jgi:hypothetical protein
MNEHLASVFNIIFPKLREKNINFWVFGGIAIAGIRGEYLRKNNDVDTFIEDKDFKKAKDILEELCVNHQKWKICYSVLNGLRPKTEIYENGNEIFSLMPIYKNEVSVDFIFPNGGSDNFHPDVLTPVKRSLSGFKFNTPSSEYVKKLSYNHYNLLLKRNYEGNHMENYRIDKKYLDSI